MDVRREFMQRLFVVLQGTMGSYLRDNLHDILAHASMICIHAMGAEACLYSLFVIGDGSP
jgi:hypothetical protein